MIVVLGSNGMLGGMVKSHFKRVKNSYFPICSSVFRIEPESQKEIYRRLNNIIPGNAICLINCIGAIKPKFQDANNLESNIFVNSVFPHILAQWGIDRNIKIIHITTDCVYDGLDGGYTESVLHNALDIYGKSKSLGEPNSCMVLRTSIIGPEWGGNKRSLVEWLLSNRDGSISGYTNHLWNGVTTLELAKCIEKIIKQDLHSNDTYHVYSEDINKYDLLCTLNNAWNLGIEIEPVKAAQYCNRTMRTERGLNTLLGVASHRKMAEDLVRYINMDR